MMPKPKLRDQVFSKLKPQIPQIFRNYVKKARIKDSKLNGICPFHNDHNPSFSADLEEGVWHCFSCGAKGTIFDFIQRMEDYPDFKQTLASLAKQYGIATDHKKAQAEGNSCDLEKAAKKFHENLISDEKQLEIITSSRGINTDTVRKYQIGWNPRDGLRSPFQTTRFSIPIRDEQGSVVNIRLYNRNAGKLKMINTRGFGTAAIFGLDELKKADKSKWVIVAEGEWDKLRLSQKGFLAVTGTAGASTWKKEWSAHFKGRKVAICYDCDEAGNNGAQRVAAALVGVASEVRIVKMPLKGTKEDKDVSDYFRSGKTAADFQALLDATDVYKCDNLDSTRRRSFGGFPLTDLGNAQRLIAMHGNDVRFSPIMKRWLYFDGKRWIRDESNANHVMQLAKAMVSRLYDYLNDLIDQDEKDRIRREIERCESAHRLKAVVELAQTEAGVLIAPAYLDKDTYLLNCQNGTLNLRTGELQPHRHEDYITKIINCEFDPNAEAPVFMAFLKRIMGNDDELIEFVLRTLGYSLTGDIREQCVFLLYGKGANGKSTLLLTFSALLGDDYARKTPTETFLDHKYCNGASNDIARLDGARFVTTEEADIGSRLAESLIKQVTGGDIVTARFLYGEYFQFQPQFKLLFATNNLPQIKGIDHAIWRRIKLIPFNVTIPDGEMDRELPSKLSAEFPGILRLSVDACLRWQKDGMGNPQSVQRLTERYRSEMDELGDFINSRCVTGDQFHVRSQSLCEAYADWCKESDAEPLSLRQLSRLLRQRGFEKSQGTCGVHKGLMHWRGIGLASEVEREPYLNVIDPGRVEEVDEVEDFDNVRNIREARLASVASCGAAGRIENISEFPLPSSTSTSTDDSADPGDIGAKRGVL